MLETPEHTFRRALDQGALDALNLYRGVIAGRRFKVIEASAALFELYLGLIQERRRKPQDDIINVIMETEVTDDEDGSVERDESREDPRPSRA